MNARHGTEPRDELRLAEPDGLSEFERRVRSDPLPAVEPPAVQRPRWQFSLPTLLLLTLCVAVGLSGHSWISPTIFAGAVGLVSLLCLMWAVVQPDMPPRARSVWWGLNLIYLSAVVAALVRMAA